MRRAKRARAATLPRLILLIAAVILAVVVLVALGRGLIALINVIRSDGGALEPDPMFPEEIRSEAEFPEELDDHGTPPQLGDDPSVNWVYEELNPVDKTAEELAAEAE